jgi:hypothetical protein
VTTHKTLPSLFLITLLAQSSACLFSQGDSCEATIQGISLDADVYNEQDGDVVARGSFEFGDMSGIGGTSLELCETDALHINGERAREYEDQITNRLYYDVSFSSPQDEYEFVFSREGEDDVVARVSQPPAFEIVSPGNQETVSRADGLTIEWDPAGDETIEIVVDPEEQGEASCLAGVTKDVEDSGAYTFLTSEFELPADAEKVDQCRIDIQLQREQSGEYPSEFDNGSIRAFQTRWVEAVSVP